MPSYDNILNDISGGVYATRNPTLPQTQLPLQQRQPERNPDEGDLDAAVGQRVSDLVRRIVRTELNRFPGVTPELEEKLSLDCLAAVLASLDMRRTDAAMVRETEDLDAFATVEARRAVSNWWRNNYPGFHRVRTELRYVLTADRRFGLWQNMHGDAICGLARWQMERRSTVTDPSDAIAGLSSDLGPDRTLEAIFQRLGAPVYFNDLVGLCARLWNVTDSSHIAPRKREPLLPTGQRADRLRRVWEAIRGLSPRQRAVIVLSSWTDDHQSGAELMRKSGAATPREIATAINLPPEDFVTLLPRLPLSDIEAASLLRLSERQVVHLRRYARERLRRLVAA